jgi:cation diffusion facilitator family transporter
MKGELMSEAHMTEANRSHGHVFLAPGHERNERRAWAVIALCGLMMIAEIVGGLMFGSIALVADGLHMSTHAGALLLAALAYTYSRRHVHDPRFTFGTGKFGDLAGFTSAIVLAMIALLIGYEAVTRFLQPVAIHFEEAIPIAVLGLLVNVTSAWLLGAGGHDHHHGHGHSHGERHSHGHEQDDAEEVEIETRWGGAVLSIAEEGGPPRFRLAMLNEGPIDAAAVVVETVRPNGDRQKFHFVEREGYLESADEIPEPHAFTVQLVIGGESHSAVFTKHEGNRHARDNNMRSAVIHVVADAMVSVLVIIGLLLARGFGWVWMDPLAGIIGAIVIASWSYGLIRDTGAILLDMNPDRDLAAQIRQAVEVSGDEVADLHLWRLGPGHLGAIVSVATETDRDERHYRDRLSTFPALSHLTVEVVRAREMAEEA